MTRMARWVQGCRGWHSTSCGAHARQVQSPRAGGADCDLAGEVSAGPRLRSAQLAQVKALPSGTAGAGFGGALANSEVRAGCGCRGAHGDLHGTRGAAQEQRHGTMRAAYRQGTALCTGEDVPGCSGSAGYGERVQGGMQAGGSCGWVCSGRGHRHGQDPGTGTVRMQAKGWSGCRHRDGVGAG